MKRMLVVIGVLALALAGCAPVVAPPSADEAFWGAWVNEDADTGGITHAIIRPWTVHMWGACTPTDCDWGETTYAVHEDELQVVWDQGFAVLVQVLALLPGGLLRVDTTTYYTDGTGTATFTDTFLREAAVL